MKRYFFFDIDGTLTTPLTADYPDSAREAVRRLQEKGNFVAIASGRLQADAVDVAEDLKRVTDRYYETVVDSRYDYRRAAQIYKIFIACAKREVKEIPLHTLPHVWLTKGTMLVEPVHKERGIFEIMKRYNVSDDRIVVFGDGLNDCSMFRPEWMTVAMGNAKPVLKKKARYITDDADDDGIYNACRHFGWI